MLSNSNSLEVTGESILGFKLMSTIRSDAGRTTTSRRLAVVSSAACLAAALTWIWHDVTAPTPPPLRLSGVEPKVKSAIETTNAFLSGHRRSPHAWAEMGIILLANDLPEQASVYFGQAELLDPREPAWPYFQGICLLSSKSTQAADAFRRAAALSSDTLPVFRLAEMLLQEGQIDETDQIVSRILEVEPADPRANLVKAFVHSERSELQKAKECVTRCLASAPDTGTAHSLLARIYFQLGDRSLARKHNEVALSLPQTDVWPDRYLAELSSRVYSATKFVSGADTLWQLSQKDRAIELLHTGLRRCGDDESLYYSLGRRLEEAGNYKEAEAALRKSIELNKANARARRALGRTLNFLERYEEATEQLQLSIELNPNDGAAFFELGRSLMSQGRFREAIAPCVHAVEIRPHDSHAYGNLALALVNQGKIEEASNVIQTLLKLSPDDHTAQDVLRRIRDYQTVLK